MRSGDCDGQNRRITVDHRRYTVTSLFLVMQMPRDIPEDAGFQRDKAVALGDTLKGTPCTLTRIVNQTA